MCFTMPFNFEVCVTGAYIVVISIIDPVIRTESIPRKTDLPHVAYSCISTPHKERDSNQAHEALTKSHYHVM